MIRQNPQRYSRVGDEVLVAANPPAVTPLAIGLSPERELLPLLEADGIIVECAGRLLVSPKTLASLSAAREGGDPHYWYTRNGEVKTVSGLAAPMGDAVPIIKVDVSGLQGLAAQQEFVLRTAGVTEVDWSYDDPGPVPKGILEQINWTISPSAERPADRWRLSDLGLGADYSYATLKIAPPAEGGRIDYNGIAEIVKRVSERLADLRVDFNRIGDIYFDGVLPEGVGESDLIVSAITEVPPAQGPDPNRQRVRKETRLAGVDSGPTERGNAGADVVTAIGAADSTSDTTPPAAEDTAPASPVDEGGRRTIVDRAVGVANTAIRFLGLTTPVGLIFRGLRKLFRR
jgi:hypothetical protein